MLAHAEFDDLHIECFCGDVDQGFDEEQLRRAFYDDAWTGTFDVVNCAEEEVVKDTEAVFDLEDQGVEVFEQLRVELDTPFVACVELYYDIGKLGAVAPS